MRERPKGARAARKPIELTVEVLPPTLQQKEKMQEGLRIVAEWLLRHHRDRKALSDGLPAEAAA